MEEEAAISTYQVLVDFAPVIVALIGILVGRQVLRKKLVEKHISSKLIEIQEANSSLIDEAQKLIDKYVSLSYKVDNLSHELQDEIIEEIRRCHLLSLKGSSEVATLMYYLTYIIETSFLSVKPNGEREIFAGPRTLSFINTVLQRAIYYSSLAVPIPKSSRLKSSSILNPILRPFVPDDKFHRYRKFKIGANYDQNSAIASILSGDVYKSKLPVFMRSFLQVLNTPIHSAKALILQKLYAPPTLKRTERTELPIGGDDFLHLVGFASSIEHKFKENKKVQLVHLYYANSSNFKLFAENLVSNSGIKDFVDDWLTDSGFDSSLNSKVKLEAKEVIQVTFEEEYLSELYKQNRRAHIKKTLRELTKHQPVYQRIVVVLRARFLLLYGRLMKSLKLV